MSSHTVVGSAAVQESTPAVARVIQRVVQALTTLIDGAMIVEDRWSGPLVGLESNGVNILAAVEHLSQCRGADDVFEQAYRRMRRAIAALEESADELLAAAEAGQLCLADIDQILRLRNAAMAATNERVGALLISRQIQPVEKQLRHLIPFALSRGEARRWRVRRRLASARLQAASGRLLARTHSDERGASGDVVRTPVLKQEGK